MKVGRIINNLIICLGALLVAFALGFQFQKLDVEEHITTVFVFAVFMISLFTDGYVYGVVSAFFGTVAVNYAFTYPYFTIDFINSVNLISGVIMVAVSLITSLLVTKIKYHESIKAESERERTRANLLRSVSHDLRTPLTTISSASSVLIENGDALSEEKKEEMLFGIREDSEWLLRIVENLLSITRIDNETMRISTTPVILDELIDSAVKKFKSRHGYNKLMLELPSEIVIIQTDPVLIEQVIINLLENAVYHAKGMTELHFRVFTLGNRVNFEIADNGCGN